jgi:hypothetical protein
MVAQVAPAHLIDAQVSRDGVQPRREARSMFELGRIVDHAHERVLHDLFRGRGAPQLPQGKVVEGRLVTAHEQRERRPIAVLKADHQSFVRDFAARGCRVLHTLSRLVRSRWELRRPRAMRACVPANPPAIGRASPPDRSSLIVARDFQSPAAPAARRSEKHQAPGGVAKTAVRNIDSSRLVCRVHGRPRSAAAGLARIKKGNFTCDVE